MQTPLPAASNKLLSTLSSKKRNAFIDRCQNVDLKFNDVLAKPGDFLDHVFFPLRGFVSQLTPVDRASLEVGLIGNEGMLGTQVSLGVSKTTQTSLVQGQGEALRMTVGRFREELKKSAPLRRAVGRYTYVVMSQASRNAGCNRFHVVESRLARWLLMTADRAHSDSFAITQAFLASMLGVRRVGVTLAAGGLQALGLIRYTRGKIHILDKAGLRAKSCSCYRSDIDVYSDTLGFSSSDAVADDRRVVGRTGIEPVAPAV